MGKRGDGYGSEDHFLKQRAEQPEALDRILLEALGAPDGRLEWVYPTGAEAEREPEGFAFLRDRDDVQPLWRESWPQRGSAQTWDGVAKLHTNATTEWVLIEAKATVEFVTPSCGASERSGRKQIETTLNRVKAALGVHRHYPWLGTYYQYANRLAVLHFLNEQAKVSARLLHLYFIGDCFPDGRECPASLERWRELMEARRITLGLPATHRLSDRTHEAFVQV